MEGLHCALSTAVSSNLIHGITLDSHDLTLSHLFYFDEVIITTEWNPCDLDNIIRVLHVFYLASGLKININKSNIYGIGVSEDEVSNMARNYGCAAGSFPFTYLGLPIGSTMNRIGGRLTLIKAVLCSLGIYYLSIFKASEIILKSLESLRAKFFWGGQDSKKLIWIKWANVLSCFEKEGLNIGSLKSFNLALLQKWRWRWFSFPNALWVKVIKAIHGQEGGFDTYGCKFNGIWDRIVGSSIFLHSKNIILLNYFRFKAGCGTRIRFWKDIWIGDSPLNILYNRLYQLELDKDCLIIDRIENGQWSWNWYSNDLGVRNTNYFRDLLIEISRVDISMVEDTCIWSLAKDDIFSVKEACRVIDDKILPSLATSTSWDKTLPRKVNIFMWRLMLDRLPHRLNLSS
ncbi:hypothetical protein Tco_0111348 [Tanacetum coccineum]